MTTPSDEIIRMAREAELIHKADDEQYLDYLERFAALVAAAVPEGWRLVPVEPTEEMFFDANDVCVSHGQTPWDAFKRIYASLLAAAPQPEVQAWNVPDTAPKDGRLLRLLVEFEDGNLEDNDQPQETIGHNSLNNTGLDEWQFAGWNWTHDCYTEGTGKVLGWLPMRDAAPLPEAQPTEAAQKGVLNGRN